MEMGVPVCIWRIPVVCQFPRIQPRMPLDKLTNSVFLSVKMRPRSKPSTWPMIRRMVSRLVKARMRFSVGAVNVGSGNFVYFDNSTHSIGTEHVMASAALPPGLPGVEIEGQLYWDGGLVSNTPLEWVLESQPSRDTLAFQVDLWSARGPLPRTMAEVMTRQKEIQFSSRTRASSDRFKNTQKMRNAAARSRVPSCAAKSGTT